MQQSWAKALLYRGLTHNSRGERSEAIAVYEEVVARFGQSSEPALREQVAKAMFNKGVALGALKRNEKAIAVSRTWWRASGNRLSRPSASGSPGR